MKILTVGGGPAGALASVLLARRGHAVTLIEQHRFPRDKVCGECLSALGGDEALIAFSNAKYYGGRLVTFPSPTTRSDAVRLHRVAGVYDRGGSRTNRAEADAIAALAVARLREWSALPETERPTLGVITFNAQQQALILDLLDAARTEEPELEWFFDEAREEPVIVKNLENIQGDERDVMLFSVTFGPDAAGKLAMSFGAVNLDGGERRLNVAVTRARRELHVFASLGAEDVDLARTRARGARDLKAFLDYAARGPVALAAEEAGSLGPPESPFEAQVKAALEARGWEVRAQVGVSGFRIDLGVVHPDHAGAYLAGVECDGATYHASATARDRDRIREAVLRGLGWEIERVWSTDWFVRRADALERLHAALEALLAASRAAAAGRGGRRPAGGGRAPGAFRAGGRRPGAGRARGREIGGFASRGRGPLGRRSRGRGCPPAARLRRRGAVLPRPGVRGHRARRSRTVPRGGLRAEAAGHDRRHRARPGTDPHGRGGARGDAAPRLAARGPPHTRPRRGVRGRARPHRGARRRFSLARPDRPRRAVPRPAGSRPGRGLRRRGRGAPSRAP